LEAGDYVVFCSDGIIETANTDEGIFGFEQTAVATIKKACAEALIDRLIGVAQDSAGDDTGDSSGRKTSTDTGDSSRSTKRRRLHKGAYDKPSPKQRLAQYREEYAPLQKLAPGE
jgi:hypothetical protein